MNILVCGTREELDDRQEGIINGVLSYFFSREGVIVIEGGASGVDTFAHHYAKSAGWGHRCFPADWTRFGRSAGPIRNQQMLDENEVDLVLAFPVETSRGTWDMVERAVANRIPVRVYLL